MVKNIVKNLSLTFLLLTSSVFAANQQPFSFITIGDTPYSEVELEALQGPLGEAIKDSGQPFVIHYGDLKGGGEACSRKLLKERRELINDFLPGRVFYTPGDNEWADCDRAFLKPALSELEMLSLLRKMFFRKPMDLPKEWAYKRQANFPENARWLYKDVLFVTVHLISTNNGRIEILKDDIELALALVEARDQANRVWIEEAFAEAKDKKAQAIVIATQADVTAPDGSGTCSPQNRMNCDAFSAFRDNLIRLASGFADRGQPRRPVLLIHGDTNPYCLDKAFGGKTAPNIWRLNAWGDYKTPADATVVTFQPENSDVPFTVKTLLEGELPDDSCY